MWVKWGIAWLAAVLFTVSLTWAPVPGLATEGWDKSPTLTPQTPMEAQMLGEKPSPTPPASGSNLLSDAVPGLRLDQDGGAVLRLPRNLAMKISFLYSRENDGNEPPYIGPARRRGPLMLRYSLDYRLLPNLQVGLNSYLYRPDSGDSLALSRQLGDHGVMGLGPGLKYDLGRWSFVVKSQLETGGERKDMQNWFRVWYAF